MKREYIDPLAHRKYIGDFLGAKVYADDQIMPDNYYFEFSNEVADEQADFWGYANALLAHEIAKPVDHDAFDLLMGTPGAWRNRDAFQIRKVPWGTEPVVEPGPVRYEFEFGTSVQDHDDLSE